MALGDEVESVIYLMRSARLLVNSAVAVLPSAIDVQPKLNYLSISIMNLSPLSSPPSSAYNTPGGTPRSGRDNIGMTEDEMLHAIHERHKYIDKADLVDCVQNAANYLRTLRPAISDIHTDWLVSYLYDDEESRLSQQGGLSQLVDEYTATFLYATSDILAEFTLHSISSGGRSCDAIVTMTAPWKDRINIRVDPFKAPYAFSRNRTPIELDYASTLNQCEEALLFCQQKTELFKISLEGKQGQLAQLEQLMTCRSDHAEKLARAKHILPCYPLNDEIDESKLARVLNAEAQQLRNNITACLADIKTLGGLREQVTSSRDSLRRKRPDQNGKIAPNIKIINGLRNAGKMLRRFAQAKDIGFDVVSECSSTSSQPSFIEDLDEFLNYLGSSGDCEDILAGLDREVLADFISTLNRHGGYSKGGCIGILDLRMNPGAATAETLYRKYGEFTDYRGIPFVIVLNNDGKCSHGVPQGEMLRDYLTGVDQSFEEGLAEFLNFKDPNSPPE